MGPRALRKAVKHVTCGAISRRGTKEEAIGMSGRDAARAHGHSHLIIILLSILVGIGLAATWYHPRTTVAQTAVPPTRLQGIEEEFVAIADRAKKAVVKISAHVFSEQVGPDVEERWRRFFEEPLFPWLPERRRREAEPRRPVERVSQGSGFFFQDDGHILTNHHVVAGAKKIDVELLDGRQLEARLIGADKKTELAVLKIVPRGKVEFLPLGDSDAARVGTWAIAIGMPFREAWSVTVGVVSARGRSIPGETDYLQLTDLIQTDAAINPGNSGGPLLNIRGEVIGINVAIRTYGPVPRNAGIGYAIPSNTAQDVIPQLLKEGRVARGYLGIGYKPLAPDQREAWKAIWGVDIDHGMYISHVVDGSPADKAGLQYDDVLIKFADKELKDTEDLQHIVSITAPGTTVEVVVVRGGETKTLKVKLGEVPAEYIAEEKAPAARTAAREDGKETVMGISVEDLAENTAQELGLADAKGVIITDIDPDSPAIGKPLRPGDVITKVHGKPVADAKSFKAAVEKLKGSSIIAFNVVRKVGDDVGRDIVTIRPK